MQESKLLRPVGKNIRDARLQANLTQECLAELVGIHWQTISCIERGVYPVSLVTFAKLCQHLEVSPNRLLDGLPAPDAKRAKRIRKALARKRRPSA